jgi:beta-galactosidase
MNALHVAHWGVAVTTPTITANTAAVRIETMVQNDGVDALRFALQTDLVASDGTVVATGTATAPAASGAPATVVQTLKISRPQLWSTANPALYVVHSSIKTGGAVVDETTTPFGIRTAVFDPDHGFLLNGVPTKLKGVCIHHDAGSLGAAVPDAVLERRLRALQDLGVNAIRTSHNPPDPALLDLCDRLGLLVMDEAFDEFTPGKNKWVVGWNAGVPSRFGYAEVFAQWSVTDVSDMVRRDRNHPGIILWSIGNEIDYANDPFSDPSLGAAYRPENPPAKNLLTCAAPLVQAVKALDRTRPVTAALATVVMSDAVGLPELLDAVGYNYQEARYPADHAQYPHRVIYGSENSQSYGAWRAVATNNYIAGQFLWTGIDYLGEARVWPNRASGAGLLDLCGFKKPSGWFRQSLWSDRPMVYLCASTNNTSANNGGRRGFGGVESWNWPAGSAVTVQCFANCPEVTLTLNDQIIGTKTPADAVNGVLTWEIPFAPGRLQAIGRTNGVTAAEFTLQTASAPARIELLPDTTQWHANGRDVCHLEYRIVDAQGVRVPNAGDEVTFTLAGPGRLLGIGNADLSNSEPCQDLTHRAYQGRGLAILQAGDTPGGLTVQATAPGLTPAAVTLTGR